MRNFRGYYLWSELAKRGVVELRARRGESRSYTVEQSGNEWWILKDGAPWHGPLPDKATAVKSAEKLVPGGRFKVKG